MYIHYLHISALLTSTTPRGILYLGTLCEVAPTKTLYESPRHPYTKALLSAIPRLGGKHEHIKLTGEVPSPINLPSGCVFHGRCSYADERCRQEIPELLVLDLRTRVACHRVQEGVL